MKNRFLIITICTFVHLQSCTTSVVPLRGKYQEGSVKSKIEKPFESVWESVIDLIAETGVSVKMIDKASGLIIADIASFSGLLSFEESRGDLANPKAHIVIERLNSDFPNSANKYDATAIWNMRVKPLSGNVTVVSVNLHSIRVDKALLPLRGKSTGNFEKWLIDGIFEGVE
ncbi:hypothetical protein [Dyadobacter luticola]|uniref:Uncharacterized protein n=1 Tax=Dyadobacter luticola TaxID=1979387 RepID=A0A5R9KVV5_9BACT|nr:hypothetical protein [Dyadobacter luticola]TLV00406.1 hypothetical protein FEN17_13015 [Dyadobacter luticola]